MIELKVNMPSIGFNNNKLCLGNDSRITLNEFTIMEKFIRYKKNFISKEQIFNYSESDLKKLEELGLFIKII